METSILRALLRGQLNPWERPVPVTPERKQLGDQIEREHHHFMSKLSSDDGIRFDAFQSLLFSANFDEETHLCASCFAFGALLMLEILDARQALR